MYGYRFWGRRLIFILILASLLAMGGILPRASAGTTEKLAPALGQAIASASDGDMLTAVVRLQGQADLQPAMRLPQAQRGVAVVQALHANADDHLRQLDGLLQAGLDSGSITHVQPLWAINGFVITARPEVLQELAAHKLVKSLSTNETYPGPELMAGMDTLPEMNLDVIGAEVLWEMGYRGQGVVIADMDTGVYLEHPDLVASWRGGTNSWFDPYGEHPNSPVDTHGHGTMTMGVMVGGNSGGSAIGVAPEAQWIAARLYNDQNVATTAAIHLAFQWLLDPDGNPATDDAPDVVNNSWLLNAGGCDLEFADDVHALRAAGILPIFSGGNNGPDPNTGRSPANYSDSFAVTSTANYDMLLSFSSRGPADCGTEPRMYPQVVAPGLDIRTTSRLGGYTSVTGSSIASPQVAGGLALLLSAFPGLTPDQQAEAFLATSVDLGPAGPDNDYGYGRIDLPAAYYWLMEQSIPQPTPTPPIPTELFFRVFVPLMRQ